MQTVIHDIICVEIFIFAGNQTNYVEDKQTEIINKILNDKKIQVEAKLSNHSPRKKRLRLKNTLLMKKNKNLEKRLEVSKCKTKNLSTFEEWYSLCDKFLPPETAAFTKTQAKLYQQSSRGKKYSMDFKMLCLKLYFAGPKSYNTWSSVFCLPTSRTLERMIEGLRIPPGVHDIIFNILKTKTAHFDNVDKLCIMCIDEASIKANLFYNINLDEVIGFEDIGDGKSSLPACNIAVIMLRGLCTSWKQPIAYFFLNTTFKAEDAKRIILQVIVKLQEIGLKLIALVSDMGSNFSQMAHSLGVKSESPYFEVNDEIIFYFYDTPHIVKAVRNNFKTNIIKIETKCVSWSYVERLYNVDKTKNNRLAPKLTESHIHPTNFQRMKVKLAAQTLSHTVSAALNTYISIGLLPEDAAVTAEFIENIDNLFDIFNSSTLGHAKKYKGAFQATDFQTEFLLYMKKYLSNIRIYNKSGKDITNTVKTFKSWILNINSLLQLWPYLQNIAPDLKFLLMRRFNQDPLENFFGKIRSLNGNAFNPTPIQFYFNFRKLFATQYLTVSTGNCETDKDQTFFNLNELNQARFITEQSVEEMDMSVDDHDYHNLDLTEENSFRYICGYLIRKCMKKHSCDTCVQFSKDYMEVSVNTAYCFHKDYDSTEIHPFSKLLMPNDTFVQYMEILERLFFEHINNFITQKLVISNLLTIFNEITFNHPCKQFPVQYLLKLYSRVRLFYTLKFVNQRFKSQAGHRKVVILQHS